MKAPIYFDHHATTPVDPHVFEAMRPYFTEIFGNAMSGQHSFGWAANNAVEAARTQVARLLRAEPREIFFTSGATESIHLALHGFLESHAQPAHIITSTVEHKCVLETVAHTESLGHTVTYLPVNKFGQIEVEQFQQALTPQTRLVSLVHGNNEIGSLNPIAEIGRLCRARQITFHVDAAQSVGRVPIDVNELNIDLLSLSAHKLYGPKGVGALFVRHSSPRVRIAPMLRGGGQEKGLRAGTHNVPGIVGLGKACELAEGYIATETPRLTQLRDHLIHSILSNLSHVYLNGHPSQRLCNNVNMSIAGIDADQLLIGLNDVAFSSASACSSGSQQFSHVLKAIGQSEADGLSTVRFGLGRTTMLEEVNYVASKLIELVRKSREKTNTYKQA